MRYAKTYLNKVNGMVLFPDELEKTVQEFKNINQSQSNFNENNITIIQWKAIEQAGAVFLPVGGLRFNNDSHDVWNTDYYGTYWSSLCNKHGCPGSMDFLQLNQEYSFGIHHDSKAYGRCVRLGHPA